MRLLRWHYTTHSAIIDTMHHSDDCPPAGGGYSPFWGALAIVDLSYYGHRGFFAPCMGAQSGRLASFSYRDRSSGRPPRSFFVLEAFVRFVPVMYAVGVALLLVACQPHQSTTLTPLPSPSAISRPSPSALSAIAPAPTAVNGGTMPSSIAPTVSIGDQMMSVFGYTYQRPDGNRLVAGRGAMPATRSIDVPLGGVPRWVVTAPLAQGSLWAVALDDGRIQAFRLVGGHAEPVAMTPDRLPPGMPPLLRVDNGVPSLVVSPSPAAAPFTHPVVLNPSGQLAFVETNGDLVIWGDGEVARLPLRALPDARLIADDRGRLLLLTDATTRYDHGVLGDAVEAASITLVETAPTPRVALTIPIPDPLVVEGIAPIWADLTGDGIREIIVTLSDASQGAWIAVFNEAGERVAAGPPIGQGRRWRHQLAVAPFGPTGELRLADVLTPHIGGIVEFNQLAGDALQIVDRTPGYTSHAIGSRNFDQALAGDFDGDGYIELLLPNQAMTELGAVRQLPGGAEVSWTVPVGDRMSTNLAAVALFDGGLAVGVGHAGGVLRIWLP